MNTKFTETIIDMFTKFGVLCQLPAPDPEYVIAVQEYLSAHNWRLSELNSVLNALLKDEKYAETIRFNKYPTIPDFFRIKKKTDSKPFYDALSAYLSGCFWEKENVYALASPAQANAIMQAGGLENLYQRATGDMPTPVYKLIDMIAEAESDAPTDLIDTKHRIGAPTTLKQIGKEKPKGENK